MRIRRKTRRKKNWPLLILVLVAVAALWYLQLDERQKRFVQNIVKQIPCLPARYWV